MSSPPMELSFYLSLSLLCSISIIAHSTVRPNSTFKYFNEGEFGDFLTEYRATFRPLDITESVFQLLFYNTTPDAYTLAIRMGSRRSESLRRYVWEAN
ncbi:hypothetical protein OIU79_026637 [Salix purpurea]|uniref:Uncharacterized protein n=1 Tax=Salix purpurea TaxID=77065 RepID=A0A9Q0VT06_SALPP|nr:hypothetical protein OIU79_026637 [Salix purpurea]